MLSAQGDKGRNEQSYEDARIAQRAYNTHAADQAGTEYDKIDPTSRNAMLAALNDYENKVKMGGLDARAQANLEHGTSAAEQASQRMAAQIQAEAARRGAAQGPAAMIAQQVASQQAGERARETGLDSAALAEQARNAALQGQLGAAGELHGVDADRARAQDAINQFNVRNAQQNIGNTAHVADRLSGIDVNQAGEYSDRAKRDIAEFSGAGKGIGGSVGGLVGSMMGGGGGAAAGSYLPTDAEGTGMGG
jgi:hypothetical protein